MFRALVKTVAILILQATSSQSVEWFRTGATHRNSCRAQAADAAERNGLDVILGLGATVAKSILHQFVRMADL